MFICAVYLVVESQSDEKGIINKKLDDDLSLFCTVRGQPRANVTWLKDGQPLERDKVFTVKESYSGGLVNSTLALSDLTMEDSGYYTCRAENSLAQVDLIQGFTLLVGASGENGCCEVR